MLPLPPLYPGQTSVTMCRGNAEWWWWFRASWVAGHDGMCWQCVSIQGEEMFTASQECRDRALGLWCPTLVSEFRRSVLEVVARKYVAWTVLHADRTHRSKCLIALCVRVRCCRRDGGAVVSDIDIARTKAYPGVRRSRVAVACGFDCFGVAAPRLADPIPSCMRVAGCGQFQFLEQKSIVLRRTWSDFVVRWVLARCVPRCSTRRAVSTVALIVGRGDVCLVSGTTAGTP